MHANTRYQLSYIRACSKSSAVEQFYKKIFAVMVKSMLYSVLFTVYKLKKSKITIKYVK